MGGAAMKRVSMAVVGAAWIVLVPAIALAQEGSDLGEPEGAQVAGTGGSIGGLGGDTAFTGAEITGLIGVIVGLLILGVAVLLFTRRRRAASTV
jgi:LPXTG-motif cell wall-anchored protein